MLCRQIIPRDELAGRFLKAKSSLAQWFGHTRHCLYLFGCEQIPPSLSVKLAIIQAWWSPNATQIMSLKLYWFFIIYKVKCKLSSAWLSMASPNSFTILSSINHPDPDKTRLLASSWNSLLCFVVLVHMVLQMLVIAVLLLTLVLTCWVLTVCQAPRDDFLCINLFNSHDNLYAKDIKLLINCLKS